MFKLLTRLFVKDSENVADPAVRRSYGTLCSVYGIFLNILLFAGKFFAGTVSGSVAIVADAFNNLSDAGSSVITLLGFAIAGKKPDPDHPFGHGRAEYLAGIALSLMIMLMGFELAKSSVEKIISPEPVEAGLLPALILVASIAVKFYMASYNKAVGRKINSAAMQATATDSLSDCIATTVVLLSMGISAVFRINIDGYAGILVAAFILYAGFNALKDTVSPLLGQAPDPELVHDIEKTVMAHPEIKGIHDLIYHDYGPGRSFVSLHAEVNGKDDIFELHDAIDCAEADIRKEFGILATIHMDPIEADNEEVAAMRLAVSDKLREKISHDISIHDFRMVPGETHTNLIFDAVVPADYKLSDEQLAEEIRAVVSSAWERHFAVVHIDRSFV